MKRLTFLSLFIAYWLLAVAQPSQKLVTVIVAPEGVTASADVAKVADAYNFDLGKNVRFNVTVISSGVPVDAEEVSYSICYDKMKPHKQGSAKLKKGSATIKGGTMKESGFLRCTASVNINGTKYSGTCAVAFEPQNLKATVNMPDDFKQYWDSQLEKLAKVKMDAKLTLLPDQCTDKVNVYQVKIASLRPMYGILAIPKEPGNYPAVMRVPGAGVHKIGGYISPAEDGVITLDLGIHSIPLTESNELYQALSTGSLNSYYTLNIDSRDDYYYNKVYLGCVRAAEFLTTLPEFDGKNLFVVGGSQGGALSIVTAALCPKVTAIMSFFPALCDQEAYLYDRAGGWPHHFYFNKGKSDIKQVAEVVQYYDVVNFARILNTPTFMSFGYNDLTCAPTSTYSAWNAVAADQKQLLIVPETGHWRYPYQWNTGWDWMMNFKK